MRTSIPAKPVDDCAFHADGVQVWRDLIPHDDLDRYVAFWHEHLGYENPRYSPEGSGLRYVYTDTPEVRDLLCHPKVREVFEALDLGDLAVHSDILSWHHQGLGWHCDVLNDTNLPHCGVWIALDDIPEEAGRFHVMAESHKWDKDLSQCGLTQDSSETNLYVQDILAGTLMEPVVFDARKGDVLVWNTHCFHGASRQGHADRPAAIAHLGEESERVRHGDGMWYVP